MNQTAHKLKQRQFGLIFFVEIWERFAFYAFNILFVLFATSTGLLTEKEAYMVFGVFSALAYGSPLLGGLVADKILGAKRTLIFGAVMLVLGYMCLALADEYSEIMLSLSFIAIGNGFFKPNPSALIGKIFRDDKAKAQASFTIYYMSINIGSLAAKILSPILAQHGGFSMSFWFAAGGMLFALGNFVIRYSLLANIDTHFDNIKHKIIKILMVIILATIAVIAGYFLLNFTGVAFYLIITLTIVTYLYIILSTSNQSKKERIKQFIGTVLFVEAIVFFIVYTQMFTTLVLFAKHNVDLNIFGFEASPAIFAVYNPIWILILSPILAKLYLNRRIKEHVLILDKFYLAQLLCAIAFVILYFACQYFATDGLISGYWMILYYFLIATSELFVSALGLVVAAHYFPKEKISFFMGAWLLSTACGSTLAGKMAGIVALPEVGLGSVKTLPVFQEYFVLLASICFVSFIVYFIITIIIKRIGRKYQIDLA